MTARVCPRDPIGIFISVSVPLELCASLLSVCGMCMDVVGASVHFHVC